MVTTSVSTTDADGHANMVWTDMSVVTDRFGGKPLPHPRNLQFIFFARDLNHHGEDTQGEGRRMPALPSFDARSRTTCRGP